METLMMLADNYSWLLYLLIAWSILWKGLALWHAARNNQLVWYIVLLVVNTVGLLEILYLVFFRKRNRDRYRFY
jgi:predicted membrane channel-forming protein YqfA (hemolysin III family)